MESVCIYIRIKCWRCTENAISEHWIRKTHLSDNKCDMASICWIVFVYVFFLFAFALSLWMVIKCAIKFRIGFHFWVFFCYFLRSFYIYEVVFFSRSHFGERPSVASRFITVKLCSIVSIVNVVMLKIAFRIPFSIIFITFVWLFHLD